MLSDEIPRQRFFKSYSGAQNESDMVLELGFSNALSLPQHIKVGGRYCIPQLFRSKGRIHSSLRIVYYLKQCLFIDLHGKVQRRENNIIPIMHMHNDSSKWLKNKK